MDFSCSIYLSRKTTSSISNSSFTIKNVAKLDLFPWTKKLHCFCYNLFMNKAFIFDLDGVIIDDESIWEEVKKELYQEVLGKEIYAKLGPTIGLNMNQIYERALQSGSTISKQTLFDAFYKVASKIYQTAPITPGLEELVNNLTSKGYLLGIVSSSPKAWIDTVLKRLPYREQFKLVLSIIDRPELQPKPAPDSFIEAMHTLDVLPESTFILEDSNPGIAAAKAAGAYTIGLRQNLVEGHEQEGADSYADTLDEVLLKVLQRKSL